MVGGHRLVTLDRLLASVLPSLVPTKSWHFAGDRSRATGEKPDNYSAAVVVICAMR